MSGDCVRALEACPSTRAARAFSGQPNRNTPSKSSGGKALHTSSPEGDGCAPPASLSDSFVAGLALTGGFGEAKHVA
jgi:hypothetical protein